MTTAVERQQAGAYTWALDPEWVVFEFYSYHSQTWTFDRLLNLWSQFSHLQFVDNNNTYRAVVRFGGGDSIELG